MEDDLGLETFSQLGLGQIKHVYETSQMFPLGDTFVEGQMYDSNRPLRRQIALPKRPSGVTFQVGIGTRCYTGTRSLKV